MSKKLSCFCAVVFLALVSHCFSAIEIKWDGGEGEWIDANWNGGESLFDLVGQEDGSNGYRSNVNPDEGEHFFISGSDSIVSYDADAIGSDFRLKQGASMTISDGATWQQISTDDWTENRWTEMDASELTIDGGIFRRIGEVGDEGGGALIFASWRGDDNFSVSPLDYEKIDINIINGGRLENEGQLWFGSWGDTPPNGTTITMTINDGVLDLTGGDVPIGEAADGDLVFTNRFIDEVDQPKYAINFTGPGSIKVDEAGIIYSTMDETETWNGLDPISYEDLWNLGVLQVDGKSGVDGLDFVDFFEVSGKVGGNDYTLMRRSLLLGDFNENGELDAGDIDLLSAAVRTNDTSAKYDLNGDGSVNAEDRTTWVVDLKNTYFGDANLDGEFNSSDFVTVFAAGEYEDDIPNNSTWATGDWNGDTEFDSSDFVTAFTGAGYEKGPRMTAAVPEPSSTFIFIGLLPLLAAYRRRW